MLDLIKKDFKIASIASKAIVILTAIKNVIVISVMLIFALQIAKFSIQESRNEKSAINNAKLEKYKKLRDAYMKSRG